MYIDEETGAKAELLLMRFRCILRMHPYRNEERRTSARLLLMRFKAHAYSKYLLHNAHVYSPRDPDLKKNSS
jgi:hypothetical protein